MMKNWNRIVFILKNSDVRFQLSLIGIAAGLTSGFAALALSSSLHWIAQHIDPQISDYRIILFPPAGILITVFILKYIIKDNEGHGIPEVIHSISLKGGALRLRSSFSKLVGALITISAGGSAGPEAPVVTSGSSIGSNLAKLFQASDKIKVAVTGAGAAAAIAAIFNAPITGIIFTMEVIIGEWAPVYMLPVVIASVTGTELSRLFHGNQIPFPHTVFHVTWIDILVSLGLALFTALISILFIRVLRYSYYITKRWFPNIIMRALAGGLLVGIIIYLLPHVKGEGYTLVQELISGTFTGSLILVASIMVLKIFATSTTLAAGGAGGVFAPSLVIGSASGFLYYGIITTLFPQLTLSEAGLYALIGMTGVLSGTLAAPLTGIFLIIEITSGYDAILPLLAVSFVSTSLVHLVEKNSIYHEALVRKGHLRRPRTDGRILADIRIEELLEKDMTSVHPEMLLKDMIPIIKKSKRNYFPVVSEDNSLRGMVYFNDIKEFIFSQDLRGTILVEEVMDSDLATVSPDDSLDSIQETFDNTGLWSLAVTEEGKFLGLISKATMLDLYRKELKVQTDR